MIGTGLGIYASSNKGGASFAFGNALLTDGVDDYASDSFEAAAGATQVTYSVFVNINANSESPSISLFRNGSNRFDFSLYSGRIWVAIRGGGQNAYRRIELSDLSSGINHFLVVYDASLSNPNNLVVYNNGNLLSTNVFASGEPSSLSTSLGWNLQLGQYGGGIENAKSLQTKIALDIGYAGTLADAQALWNGGNGADYREVVQDPTAYYEINEVDGATTLVDSMGYANLTLNNFSTPPAYIVDFENYTP